MSLLNVILRTSRGESHSGTNALLDLVSKLLHESGGLPGLMQKFSQAGLDRQFASWVGTGANEPLSSFDVQKVFGPAQLGAIADQIGIDRTQLSALAAQFLPGIIDRLTPGGRIDAAADVRQSLGNLLPSLLQQFTSGMRPPPPPPQT